MRASLGRVRVVSIPKTGNCHKWLCAPKGAGFLHVRPEHQDAMAPPVVGWGEKAGASFAERFRWPGTYDPAAFLAVPAAIDFLAEHGWDEVRARCHELAERARLELAELTGVPPLAPDETWLGQMVTTGLPECDHEQLKRRLYDEHRVEVPVQRFGGRPILRAAFQGYNDESDLEALLTALRAEL